MESLVRYKPQDTNLIKSKTLLTAFNSVGGDYIDVHIYDFNDNLILSILNTSDYLIESSAVEGGIDTVKLLPENCLVTAGITSGKYKLAYNFFRNKILTSADFPFFIKEISSDRTEIRLGTTLATQEEIELAVNNFITEFTFSPYYKYLTLNFKQDTYPISVNIALDTTTAPYTVLLKLYEPLPDQFQIKDQLFLVEEISDPVVVEVELQETNLPQEINKLRGPNLLAETAPMISSETDYVNWSDILTNNSQTSFQLLNNNLELAKSARLNIDYTDFNNFVHFSSAKERVLNFFYKVQLIEQYTNELNNFKAVQSGSVNAIINISSSQTKIDNLIKGFDGFESYMYFTSGSSFSYPKRTSTKPYALFSYTSSQAKEWVGSDDYTDANYGGMLYSASVYDTDNPDNLQYSVPEYIRDNRDNQAYLLFVSMIAQHFDNQWLFAKGITDIYNNNPSVNKGISKDLVFYALKSLGFKLYSGNNNTNIFEYFTGQTNTGNFLPTTGSNQTLIYVNDETIPKEDITKEIWSRIYHNIPLLLKSKGTERSVRALINSYGIPSTILRIQEYGGPEVESSSSYNTLDKFNYALNTSGGYVQHEWYPTYQSFTRDNILRYPDTIQLRFRVPNTGSQSEQYILSKYNNSTNNGFLVSIISASSSPTAVFTIYSSSNSTRYITASLGTTQNISNKWYNLTLSRNLQTTGSSTYNIIYNLDIRNVDFDIVNQIITGSYNATNISSSNGTYLAWDGPGTMYLSYNKPQNKYSTIHLQEYRYWSANNLNTNILNDHALSPENYNGNTPTSSYYDLQYRLPLGTDLNIYNLNTNPSLYSYQPDNNMQGVSVTISQSYSLIPTTASFIGNGFIKTNGTTNGLWDSNFDIYYTGTSGSGETELSPAYNGTGDNNLYDTLRIGFNGGITLFPSGTIQNYNLYVYNKSDSSYYTRQNLTLNALQTGLDITLSGNTSNNFSNDLLAAGFSATPDPTGNTNTIIYLSESLSYITQSLYVTSSAYNLRSSSYTTNYEYIHINWPSVGMNRTVSNKIRIEQSEVDNNILDVISRGEKSAYDLQPSDSNRLSISLSPTMEIDEDIANQLGGFIIDNYIGDPSNEYKNKYEELAKLKDLYYKKYFRTFNIWDYIRLIQFYDTSIFKTLKQLIPERATLYTGVEIKSDILSRTKIKLSDKPVVSDISFTSSYNMLPAYTGKYEQLPTADINSQAAAYGMYSTLEGDITTPSVGFTDKYEGAYNDYKPSNFYLKKSQGEQFSTIIDPTTFQKSSIVPFITRILFRFVSRVRVLPPARVLPGIKTPNFTLTKVRQLTTYETASLQDDYTDFTWYQLNRYDGVKHVSDGINIESDETIGLIPIESYTRNTVVYQGIKAIRDIPNFYEITNCVVDPESSFITPTSARNTPPRRTTFNDLPFILEPDDQPTFLTRTATGNASKYIGNRSLGTPLTLVMVGFTLVKYLDTVTRSAGGPFYRNNNVSSFINGRYSFGFTSGSININLPFRLRARSIPRIRFSYPTASAIAFNPNPGNTATILTCSFGTYTSSSFYQSGIPKYVPGGIQPGDIITFYSDYKIPATSSLQTAYINIFTTRSVQFSDINSATGSGFLTGSGYCVLEIPTVSNSSEITNTTIDQSNIRSWYFSNTPQLSGYISGTIATAFNKYIDTQPASAAFTSPSASINLNSITPPTTKITFVVTRSYVESINTGSLGFALGWYKFIQVKDRSKVILPPQYRTLATITTVSTSSVPGTTHITISPSIDRTDPELEDISFARYKIFRPVRNNTSIIGEYEVTPPVSTVSVSGLSNTITFQGAGLPNSTAISPISNTPSTVITANAEPNIPSVGRILPTNLHPDIYNLYMSNGSLLPPATTAPANPGATTLAPGAVLNPASNLGSVTNVTTPTNRGGGLIG